MERFEAACRLQSMAKAVGARKQLRQSMLARGAAAQWIQTSWRGHAARRRRELARWDEGSILRRGALAGAPAARRGASPGGFRADGAGFERI